MTRFAFSLISHGLAWAGLIYAGVGFVEGNLDWLSYATDKDRADVAMWWFVATTGSAAFSEIMS